MRKFLILLVVIFACANLCFAFEEVFNYISSSRSIAREMPKLGDAYCKFTQEKYIGNTVLKSGGNFKFIKDKGAIFETLYPIKSTVSYSASQNKQMNSVIVAVANGNYAYLDKNFNLYYKKDNNGVWIIGLKPKKNTVPAQQLNYIIVKGSKDISNIKISTIKNGITDISFKCETN